MRLLWSPRVAIRVPSPKLAERLRAAAASEHQAEQTDAEQRSRCTRTARIAAATALGGSRRRPAHAARAAREAVKATRTARRVTARTVHRALAVLAAHRAFAGLAAGVVGAHRADARRLERRRDALVLEALVAHLTVGILLAVEIRNVAGDELLLGVDARIRTERLAAHVAERRDADLEQLAVGLGHERRSAGVAVALARAVRLVEAQQVRVRAFLQRAAHRRLLDGVLGARGLGRRVADAVTDHRHGAANRRLRGIELQLRRLDVCDLLREVDEPGVVRAQRVDDEAGVGERLVRAARRADERAQ